MKYEILFSGENKRNMISLLYADFAQRVVNVIFDGWEPLTSSWSLNIVVVIMVSKP